MRDKSLKRARAWMLDQGHQIRSMFVQRPFRVVALSLAIVVMSGADLYLTLLYVTNTGMNEMNPLARAMMEYQSPAILGAWKMGTVVISVGILMLIRKQRSAEIGAWVGCLVMGWLMIHWVGFIDKSIGMNTEMVSSQNKNNSSWIMITTDADGADQSIID